MKQWIYKVCKLPYLHIYSYYADDALPPGVLLDMGARIDNVVKMIVQILWDNEVIFLDGEELVTEGEPLPLLRADVSF